MLRGWKPPRVPAGAANDGRRRACCVRRLLTYDMHRWAHTRDFFAPGSRQLWSDLDLDVIGVGGNALTGAFPASLTRLSALEWFNIGGTGVCVPDDPAIQAWLAAIPEFHSSGLACAGSPTRSFTDHPIVAGATRSRPSTSPSCGQASTGCGMRAGLAAYGWTDPVPRPGVTPVRLVHLLDLRSALVCRVRRFSAHPAELDGRIPDSGVDPGPGHSCDGAARRRRGSGMSRAALPPDNP